MDYVDRLAAELLETALDPRLVRLVDAVLDSPDGARVIAFLDRVATGEVPREVVGAPDPHP
ncbi:hypothetical protein [Kitasatospora kazusensis]